MPHDDLAVGTQSDVELDARRAGIESGVEARQGVLDHEAACAAVPLDVEPTGRPRPRTGRHRRPRSSRPSEGATVWATEWTTEGGLP
ncbi:hypothetical protein GCM10009858_14210 [Terrabacter carboxydivorans]|uniref:Uncharacterized protein n=1 Tax=Terrabacter carboxydivorans TaxID=619730 RepID=A0ABN3L530_9MICO